MKPGFSAGGGCTGNSPRAGTLAGACAGGNWPVPDALADGGWASSAAAIAAGAMSAANSHAVAIGQRNFDLPATGMLSPVIAAPRLCPDGIEGRRPIPAANYPRELGGSKVKIWACTERTGCRRAPASPLGAADFAPARPNEPDKARKKRDGDDGVEIVKELAQGWIAVPARAEHHAHIGERKAPRPRADERVDLKFHHRHSSKARRKGNESADHGKQAADENRDGSIAGKEMLGALKFRVGHEHIGAPALKHRAAALRGHDVGNSGADVAADRPRRRRVHETELPDRYQIAGERHDDLRWQGDARGL